MLKIIKKKKTRRVLHLKIINYYYFPREIQAHVYYIIIFGVFR